MHDLDKNFLADQLANSMEFYTIKEFADMGKEIGLTAKTMVQIFKDYWLIKPKERVSPMYDWNEFIDNHLK